MVLLNRPLSVLVLFVWIFSAHASGPDANRDFTRAKDLMDSGQESQALVSLTDFKRRHAKDPLSIEAQFLIGEINFNRRQFKEAINEYKRIYEMKVLANPRIPDAGLRIGESLFKLGMRNEAQIEWEAILRKFPKSTYAVRAKILLSSLTPVESKK